MQLKKRNVDGFSLSPKIIDLEPKEKTPFSNLQCSSLFFYLALSLFNFLFHAIQPYILFSINITHIIAI